MTQPIRVVFVCLGNICRSPLAEGAFRQHVITANLADHFDIDSAGTSGYHAGELPDRRSIDIAMENGVDITAQRSRAFVKSDLDRFDYVVAMDQSNLQNIKRLKESGHQAHLSLMLDEIVGGAQEVPDPYYGGAQGFSNVWRMVDDATQALLARIRRERQLP